MACEYSGQDGPSECDDGPVLPLTFIYRGGTETLRVCGRHRELYHRLLLGFKVNSTPAPVERRANDKYDSHSQPWTIKEIRFWLAEFAGIAVADRARLHPDKHLAPWKTASDADRDLLQTVQTAMRLVATDLARDLFEKGDPRVRAKALARVADNRAAKAAGGPSGQPLFRSPEDR